MYDTTLPALVLDLRMCSIETAPLPGVSVSSLPDELRTGVCPQQLLAFSRVRLKPYQALHVLAARHLAVRLSPPLWQSSQLLRIKPQRLQAG